MTAGKTHTNLAIEVDAVDGAAAGDVTVTGIKPEDVLVSVLFLDPDGKAAGESALSDLTDEFDITDTDTINNGGGTATTNGDLIVVYLVADPDGGDLNRN